MTTSTSPDDTPNTTPATSSPTSSPTSSRQGPGHQRDDLVPQSPSPTEGDEVSEPPRPRPGTTSRARPEPHGSGVAGVTPWADDHDPRRCDGCLMLQVVSERDEARANRDRLAHELAAARAQIAQLRRTRPDRTHARRLEAAQTALADVASLAQVQAISCRAQHRADHERNWLDVLAIIERADLAATTTPEETQPQGTERVQWGYEDANGGRYFTSEEVARAVANGESGYAVGIGRVPVVAGLRRTVTEFEPIVGEWEPVEETQPDEEPFVSGYCENGACDRCVQGPEMNLDGRMLAEECTHACHEETQP